jgi:hypothetical protein
MADRSKKMKCIKDYTAKIESRLLAFKTVFYRIWPVSRGYLQGVHDQTYRSPWRRHYSQI